MSDTSHAPKWTSVEIRTLRAAHAAGGTIAAVHALPHRSVASVHTAVRRYVGRPDTPPAKIDGAAARARLSSLPIELLVDGFSRLMERTANYQGVR